MSLESIISHILKEAETECDLILKEASERAQHIIQEAKEEAERLYQQRMQKEKILCEREKHKQIVNARVEGKKRILAAKQELMDAVFDKVKTSLTRISLKKEVVTSDKIVEVQEDIDFYLEKLRQEYETEIAKLIFTE